MNSREGGSRPWNRSTYDGIARRHGGLLYRMAFHYTRNHPDALDLVQDTYEVGLRKMPAELPQERVPFWLVAILRNRFIDQRRSFQRRISAFIPLDTMLSALPAQEPEEQPDWREIEPERLWQAAARLKPVLRDVFLLRACQRRSYAEIAAQLDIPTSTVGTRYYRALKHLRRLLEISGAEPERIRPGSLERRSDGTHEPGSARIRRRTFSHPARGNKCGLATSYAQTMAEAQS